MTQYFSYQRWSSYFEGSRVLTTPREGGSAIISFPWKCWVSVYFQHRQLASKVILKRSDPFNGSTSPGKKKKVTSLSVSASSPFQLIDWGRVLTCIVTSSLPVGMAEIGMRSGANPRLHGKERCD